MLNLTRQRFYISTNVKLTCVLLATHLDCHIPFPQKSLGCLMGYSLDCFKSLDQNGHNPHKTKYVSLKAVVDLDLF